MLILNKYLHNVLIEFPCAEIKIFLFFILFSNTEFESDLSLNEVKKIKLDIPSLFNIYGFEDQFEMINGKKTWINVQFELIPENNELYGSVKPTEISKLIQEENKIDIKPSMIQPVEEIKALGKFKVKISLHSEVDAEITINVSSADTIQ